MDSAGVENLFQPFVQHHKNVSKYGGTGLGLVIVKKLLEAMQGTQLIVFFRLR
jgi:signal transduction histidine kinase